MTTDRLICDVMWRSFRNLTCRIVHKRKANEWFYLEPPPYLGSNFMECPPLVFQPPLLIIIAQTLICDECSVNLYNFFCKGNNTFPLMKRHFPLIKFIGIGAWPVQKFCFVVRRKELVKLSSAPLQFTFNKKKMKSFEKMKVVYLMMLVR